MRGQLGQARPMDVLHDDDLLEIFFHVTDDECQSANRAMETWQSLVHVCRRWRCLIFGSPRRLNLRLLCTPKTTRESLDVWPAVLLVVEGTISSTSVDNIVFALGHSDRVCRIHLRITGRSQWDKVLAAMQVPFPALTDLVLQCRKGETDPVIPDTFLGGSAPRLRSLELYFVPFPGIPNILLSATHLVDLHLSGIPHSGYISPEVMASCLSVLTSLRILHLESLSVQSRASRGSGRLPPMTRSTLPDLTWVWFKGASEYLDDLVAQIDAPRLDHLFITFPLSQMNFDTPHLVQFISRTPRFQEPNEARVTFELNHNAKVRLLWSSDDHARLYVESSYNYSEAEPQRPQPSYMAQVCTSCLPPLSTVENLRLGFLIWDLDDVETHQWLELLRPFTAVKSLYLSEGTAPVIVAALQELIGSRISEVLPSLRNIFVEGLEPSEPLQETIGQFVGARQLSGHPIAISVWDKSSNVKPM